MTSGRWRLEVRGNEVVVFVHSPEFGEVQAGSLHLATEDILELTEIFRDRSA